MGGPSCMPLQTKAYDDDFVMISFGPALSLLFTIFTAKDCKCKCDDIKNMDPNCISGKWDGKGQKTIVSN